MVLDQRVRAVLAPLLGGLASRLARLGVTPMQLTLGGLVIGVGSVVAAATGLWLVALGLWLTNRLVDGLDGPVARAGGTSTVLGGFADIVADFTMYGAFVVGCAIGQPDARVAALVLLVTYYVNGAAFLALDGIAGREGLDLASPAAMSERDTPSSSSASGGGNDRRNPIKDGRTFVFIASLTEGTETVVAHGLFVLFPGVMPWTMGVFAGMVAISALQRVLLARRVLG